MNALVPEQQAEVDQLDGRTHVVKLWHLLCRGCGDAVLGAWEPLVEIEGEETLYAFPFGAYVLVDIPAANPMERSELRAYYRRTGNARRDGAGVASHDQVCLLPEAETAGALPTTITLFCRRCRTTLTYATASMVGRISRAREIVGDAHGEDILVERIRMLGASQR